VNEWITVAGEEMQVDFLWRTQRLVVETDGFRTHRTRQAFKRDRRRDQLLAAEGWRHARFTWGEVAHERHHVTRVLRDLHARAARSGLAAA
jgi:very-short-patch-repair endonuclease